MSQISTEQIRSFIEDKKEGGIKEENFILYQISIALTEIKDPDIISIILQPEFTYEKVEMLRIAFKEGYPKDLLVKMSESEPDAIKYIKDNFLREKYYEEHHNTNPEDSDITASFLLKTIEVTTDQVKLQLEENHHIVQFLMDNITEKNKQIELLKKGVHVQEQKPDEKSDIIVNEPTVKPSSPVTIQSSTTYDPSISMKQKKGFLDHFLKKTNKPATLSDNDKLLDLICDSTFNADQIKVITESFQEGLSIEQIMRFAKPTNTVSKMEQIREVLYRIHLPEKVVKNQPVSMKKNDMPISDILDLEDEIYGTIPEECEDEGFSFDL